jgi:hypothetical protein
VATLDALPYREEEKEESEMWASVRLDGLLGLLCFSPFFNLISSFFFLPPIFRNKRAWREGKV